MATAEKSSIACYVPLALVGLFGVLSTAASAQHIWIDPRLEGEIAVTDNSTLVETDKVADVVLNVSPGLNIRAEGAHMNAAIDYWADYLYFASDKSTEIRHNMFGLVDYEAWEDHLTVFGRASMRQTFIDRGAGLSNTIANRSANRRLVQNYTAGARLRGGWRDFANWSMGYRYGLVLSPSDNLDDETLTQNFSDAATHEFTASLGSGHRFNNLEWSVAASSSRVIRSLDVNDFKNEHLTGELWYKFNRKFAVLGAVGYSRNSLQTTELAADGQTWEAGFRYTPGQKLDLTLRYGEEGIRKIWNGRLQYFFNIRTDVTVTYEDTISANSLVLNDNVQSNSFDQQGGIVDSSGLPIEQTDPAFTLSDVDFRRQSLQMVLHNSWRSDAYYLSGNIERRTFDNDSGFAETWGLSSGFTHKINEKSELSGTLSYRRSRFEDSTRVDNYIVGGLDWSKTLSRYFKTSVSLNHSERRSNEEGADLKENTLAVYLRGTF